MFEEVRRQAEAALRADRRDGFKRAARLGLLGVLGVSAGLVVCTGNSFGQDYMIYRIMKP